MIKLQDILSESLPAMIPEYKVNIAGHHLTLRFDVNLNKTKKGVKLQFVLDQVPQDPRQLQNLANEIGTELQTKFAAHNIQVIYDTENPYKNVVGFLIPLPSISNFIMTSVLKGDDTAEEKPAPEGEEAPEADQIPDKEEPPADLAALRESLTKLAGLK